MDEAPTQLPSDPGSGSIGPHTRPTERARRGEPAEPSRLGRYTMLGVLGRGGMGTVHEARDDRIGRTVALKLLHTELAGRHAERLVREARALAKLSHPNVVQVFEVGQEQGRWFIAMERVDGQTLRKWQEQRPGWRTCVAAYVQAAMGLAAAHRAGMTHRDFKPGNCMIDREGRVRVLDFGLVRDAGDASVEVEARAEARASQPLPTQREPPIVNSLTRTGEVLGTLGYMPLEQLEGRAADARSDQWSFCASLYEAVYGERPFAAEAAGSLTLEMMRGRVRPASKGARVPRRLRRALVRGLAKDPDARWPTMDALATELGAIEGARRTWWTAAAGAMLLGGLGLVGELGERASHAEPVLAEGNEVAAAPEDGHSPSPAALALREQAEDDVAADRPDALNARLDRIEPQQHDDDPALAAEVLLWRARLMADGEDAAAALRRAHAIALQADMPSIESRAAGAMAGNMQGAHAEGVAEWMRLAWVAVERTPEDRSAAIEVAVTAAHSAALTWELAGDTGGARELLAFADAVVGDVEPDDDAYVAALLVQLAAAWESIDEPERALHWARRARALLGAVAGPDHAQWAKASEQIGRALMLSTIHGLNEALAHLDEAQAGYLARGNGMGAAVVGLEIARCLSSLDRHEAALDELRRVGEFWAAQDPVFMVHRQQAHLVAAEILLELGRRKEAAAEYERILALVDLNASDQKYRDRARQALDELRSAGPPGKRER